MGKVLAIDYGKKRIGIALSDELKIIASPQPPIIFKTTSQVLESIEALVEKEKVEEIIVGMPLGFGDKPTQISMEIEHFIDLLDHKIDIKIIAWNETLSSKMAIQSKKTLKLKKRSIDSESAKIILQEYLNEINPS